LLIENKDLRNKLGAGAERTFQNKY
jgi:hypothetical protein